MVLCLLAAAGKHCTTFAGVHRQHTQHQNSSISTDKDSENQITCDYIMTLSPGHISNF